MKHKLAVVIGRFEPPHIAHFKLFESALDIAENVVIVLGTHDSPRSIKNPFTSYEREEMIRNHYTKDVQERIFFAYVEDNLYDDNAWVTQVNDSVLDIYSSIDEGSTQHTSIVIVGHNKDSSSYYLNYFKNWKFVEIPEVISADDNSPAMSSTKIRELFFEGYMNLLQAIVPDSVYKFLCTFRKTEIFSQLKKEYDDAVKYDLQYENVPYGQVNFVTCDALVVQSGHVLLVKRKHSPGANLWALPGGHLNINETFLDGAIRELYEETNLKIPEKVLRGSIVHDEIFDNPDRSLRGRVKKKIGRTITRLFVFKLDDSQDLARVKAGDDAEVARWIPIADIKDMSDILFEDHKHLILRGLNRI